MVLTRNDNYEGIIDLSGSKRIVRRLVQQEEGKILIWVKEDFILFQHPAMRYSIQCPTMI